jgi:hypothetical protein
MQAADLPRCSPRPSPCGVGWPKAGRGLLGSFRPHPWPLSCEERGARTASSRYIASVSDCTGTGAASAISRASLAA